MPLQSVGVVVVTGAHCGIGFHTALKLARNGTTVILACRDEAKGDAAASRIQGNYSGAKIRFEALDLASFPSMVAFAARLIEKHKAVDLLVNNAGVMALPNRQITQDGPRSSLGYIFSGILPLPPDYNYSLDPPENPESFISAAWRTGAGASISIICKACSSIIRCGLKVSQSSRCRCSLSDYNAALKPDNRAYWPMRRMQGLLKSN